MENMDWKKKRREGWVDVAGGKCKRVRAVHDTEPSI